MKVPQSLRDSSPRGSKRVCRYDPSCENGAMERPRAFHCSEIKIILPLKMRKANAARIKKDYDFSTRSTKQVENISPALLNWFYANQRVLPFRTDPSPYHVWLSEIML